MVLREVEYGSHWSTGVGCQSSFEELSARSHSGAEVIRSFQVISEHVLREEVLDWRQRYNRRTLG